LPAAERAAAVPPPRYTVRDTPAVVARIDADLRRVADTVRRGDPRLCALVLTGAFARGEGAVSGGRPQNDYDFVALRGLGRPSVPYERMRETLEEELRIHVDLQPVWGLRLRWAAPSIFWYETALRGRVVWGDGDALKPIRVRDARELHPAEGLRLLVNRAAGLLLSKGSSDTELLRIQAAKGMLAALDAQLLALGEFAPSQTERWAIYRSRWSAGCHRAVRGDPAAYAWAYRYKVDPDRAPPRHPREAWDLAARTILAAIPAALAHARLSSLDAYARRDGLLDHLYYYKGAREVPGARRLLLHPTGRVRVATLRLLEEAVGGTAGASARQDLARFAPVPQDPVSLLAALRRATLQ